MTVPDIRIRTLGDGALGDAGEYVLYWMIAARRTRYNFAFEHAANLASEHGVGIVVLEALRIGYRWASDRFHAFVIDGMRDNQAALASTAAEYFAYVEPKPGHGTGLLEALSEHAVAVVTDDFPSFFLPRMIERASEVVSVRFDAVDGNGLYPMHATDRVFTTAASFRRHLHKTLPPHLDQFPKINPLSHLNLAKAEIPATIRDRWSSALPSRGDLAELDIDHSVEPVDRKGGAKAAADTLSSFLDERIERYADDRNHPESDAQSHLSPYLHFGHISAHEVFKTVADRDGWTPANLADKPTGSRTGWWGASPEAESFFDELITWREIGYNRCARDPHYADYDTLPDWAKKTLADHEGDVREFVYTLEQFETADTHDEIWNAAQRQLVRDGVIHNYLRMLWGKKILEWTESPRDALDVMIELNNKYAIDGRNPNSYSGIFWVLGRFDRAWGPERDIFGKIRFMSSDSTRKKLKLGSYLETYAAERSDE